MKKYLLAVAVSIFALGGATFATQILPTSPSSKEVAKPVVRPSLTKMLDKRPKLEKKTNTGSKLDMDKTEYGTGSTNTGDKKETKKPVVQQNAEDVKAFREENGYIVKFLKKPTTEAEKKAMNNAIQTAVKALLATQKNMRKIYESAVASGTQVPLDVLTTQADAAIAAYKAAVLPYIDATKIDDFNLFVIGRINLLKMMFLKKKNTNVDVSDTSSRVEMVK